MIARPTNTNGQAAAEPARKKRKARWNIDATLRDAALRQMLMIVADKKSSHAAACKASALLLRAEAQNQKDEPERVNNFETIARRNLEEFFHFRARDGLGVAGWVDPDDLWYRFRFRYTVDESFGVYGASRC